MSDFKIIPYIYDITLQSQKYQRLNLRSTFTCSTKQSGVYEPNKLQSSYLKLPQCFARNYKSYQDIKHWNGFLLTFSCEMKQKVTFPFLKTLHLSTNFDDIAFCSDRSTIWSNVSKCSGFRDAAKKALNAYILPKCDQKQVLYEKEQLCSKLVYKIINIMDQWRGNLFLKLI